LVESQPSKLLVASSNLVSRLISRIRSLVAGMQYSRISARLLFLLALVIILTGCVERKPEQIRKRDSPVAGELAAILKEQEGMQSGQVSSEVYREKSLKHRQAVYQFLAQSLLVEPVDLYHAAEVLQSTDTATCKENFMLAYYLANEAVRKGYDTARYMAATSLDRYLISSGLRQRYGTQVGQDRFGRYYLFPYDTTVTDHDRNTYGVASLDSLKQIVAHLNGDH
jgi:hypothetical protein